MTYSRTGLRPILIFLCFMLLTSGTAFSQLIEIDSVTIKPSYLPEAIIKKPNSEPVSLQSSVITISAKEISGKGALTLIDALNYIPGGFTETRGRQVKQFFSVRGQKYPYPEYSINGVWQKEFEELPYFFSSSDIEEIEIVRSSAALLKGLSGLAGIIDIKMREYSEPETGIRAEYGTFNTIHTSIRHGNRIGKFSFAAGAGFDHTDGPAGLHAGEEMLNLSTRISWDISDKIKVSGNAFYLDGKRDLALAVYPADQKYIDMVQSFDPYRALLTNLKLSYHPLPRYTSELQLFFSGRNPVFIDEVKASTSSERDMEYGFNLIQAFAITPTNTLRGSILYSRWIAPNGKRFYTGKRCDTETWSAVITDEQRFGNFTIDGGIKLNRTYLNEYGAFSLEGDGALFKNVTPLTEIWEPALLQGSLGTALMINKHLSLFLNGSSGQIKPRPGTLNVDLEVPGTETRFKSDIGLNATLNGPSIIKAALFYVKQLDAIVLSGTTLLDPETNIRRELYINRDQFSYGAEIELLPAKIFRHVSPFINITLMKSFKEENGDIMQNLEHPSIISSAGLNTQIKGFDLNMYFRYVSEYENDRFVPASLGPQPLGDFVTADINAGYTFGKQTTKRIYLKVRNIADNIYSTVNGYPDYGRMVHAGVEIKFSKNTAVK